MPMDTKCSAFLELKMYYVKARVEMANFLSIIKQKFGETGTWMLQVWYEEMLS